MSNEAPEFVAIDPDRHHAKYVGRTGEGKQFFLTTPFEPTLDGAPGSEFVALYLFDENGSFINALIEDFGPRSTASKSAIDECIELRLAELGKYSVERIEIRPFSIEQFGSTFGLIATEDEEEGLSASFMPGDYMAFWEPWDSGEYDT